MGVINYSGVSDSRIAPLCEKIIKKEKGQWLIVTPTYIGACRVAADLAFFLDKKIHVMPTEEEQWVYFEAKNRDTMMGQLQILKAVSNEEDAIVVAPVFSVLKKRIPKEVFVESAKKLSCGDEVERKQLMEDLLFLGYERVPLVYAPGQFSSRGDIVDVFTPYEKRPVRIDFFDEEIEEMKTFDVETQRSIQKRKSIEIFAAESIIFDEESKKRGEKIIKRRYKDLADREEELLDSVYSMNNLQQLEPYMDYFYEKPETLVDYMKNPGVIIEDPNRVYEKVEQQIITQKMDMQVLLEKEKIVPKDVEKLIMKKEYLSLYQKDKVFLFTPLPRRIKGVETFEHIHHVESRPMLSYNGKMDMLEKDIRRYLFNDYKITIVCSTLERKNNMEEFLRQNQLEGDITIKRGVLSSGMDFPEEKVCYITDGDIFGVYKRKKKRRNAEKTQGEQIKTFADIAKGDYIVHDVHGVGKFLGIEQLKVVGEKKDYLKLQYAGEDLLYIPVDQMDQIQRYIGADSGHVKVSRLNGTEWRNTKAKAKVAVANLAKELLELSAMRNMEKGYAFPPDTPWQKEFEESFSFEETQDQLRCTEEIKKDMERERPMDRLLCGDVGYGKTEVAARAMFKCVAEGKQVAMLVPTTILADQHYHTLKERFEKFPFTVEMLSRFRSAKEQKTTLSGVKTGRVDLLIGTHRLLSNDVDFKDLGLLIIDEEQRFGVKDKEKIKALRNNVDVLTLSATPIPRTLHMSLVGIRDMSVIEEPPEERYPVQTYVVEEDDQIMKETIEKELDRGGQVYVIHNRINGVNQIANKIDQLVPGKRIGVGHGRMTENALEEVMMDFVAGEIDVLVSTTIVESGIDIPNVNTILILDADAFGLSQLYQLRGRVGRSTRLAYAYLMHRKNKVLSQVAEKRLRAIREFTEFGAGFKISMRDLEIRGAGNILGGEQHGHMINVGYELYCKMVEDAVNGLKGIKPKKKTLETKVDLAIEAYIPNSYIEEEITKLTMYKKIATMGDDEDRKEILGELEDRFGNIPTSVQNLIMVAKIKNMGQILGIERISQQREKITFHYTKEEKHPPFTIFLQSIKEVGTEVNHVLEAMMKTR